MPEYIGPIHTGKVKSRFIGGGVISDPDRFLYNRPWAFQSDQVVLAVYCKMAAYSANHSNRSHEQLSKDQSIPVKVRAMFHTFAEMERAQRVGIYEADIRMLVDVQIAQIRQQDDKFMEKLARQQRETYERASARLASEAE